MILLVQLASLNQRNIEISLSSAGKYGKNTWMVAVCLSAQALIALRFQTKFMFW